MAYQAVAFAEGVDQSMKPIRQRIQPVQRIERPLDGIGFAGFKEWEAGSQQLRVQVTGYSRKQSRQDGDDLRSASAHSTGRTGVHVAFLFFFFFLGFLLLGRQVSVFGAGRQRLNGNTGHNGADQDFGKFHKSCFKNNDAVSSQCNGFSWMLNG